MEIRRNNWVLRVPPSKITQGRLNWRGSTLGEK